MAIEQPFKLHDAPIGEHHTIVVPTQIIDHSTAQQHGASDCQYTIQRIWQEPFSDIEVEEHLTHEPHGYTRQSKQNDFGNNLTKQQCIVFAASIDDSFIFEQHGFNVTHRYLLLCRYRYGMLEL